MEAVRKHFTTIDSTNTWAKQNAHLLSKDQVTLITADEQTAGRGRFSRAWVSPAKQNIYATFCFFLEKHREDIGNIPQIMAISAAECLEGLGCLPKLKWPNDVLVSGKKIAGILCETTPLSDLLCIVLGIGLNVNMPEELLQKIDRPATSLMAETGRLFDTETVLLLLKERFLDSLKKFQEEGFYPFFDEYQLRLAHKQGDLIRFDDNRHVWEGSYHSLNKDGSLRLLLDNGEIRTFIAGEILF